MLIVDCEVFKHYFLMVGLDIATQEFVIAQNKEQLENIYRKYKNDLWVGYNIAEYDQHIIKGVLCGFNPYEINNHIIKEGKSGYSYSSLLFKIKLNIYDVRFRKDRSLKQLEGFMGSDIRETTVPFNLDRELTNQEKNEVIRYCKHDVSQTALVLDNKFEVYKAKIELIKTFNLPLSDMGKTDAKLVGKILNANRKIHHDEFDLKFPKCLKLKKYTQVLDWFKLKASLKDVNVYKENIKENIFNVPCVFGWGGMHGAINNYHDKGVFINVDVALNN